MKRTRTRRQTIAALGSALALGSAGCVTTGWPTGGDEPADQHPMDSGMGDNHGGTGSGGSRDDGSRSGEPSSDDDHSEDGDGDHDHGHDHVLGHPEPSIEVRMESDEDAHHFVPHVVHIEPGGTVTWVLESGVHDTVAYHPDNADLLPSATERRIPDGADPWASDVYDAVGDSFERTFEQEGVYDYVCTISGHGHRGGGHHGDGHHGGATHESTGMVGRVIVGDPDLEEQPALQPPSDALPETARHELDSFNERTRSALEGEDGH